MKRTIIKRKRSYYRRVKGKRKRVSPHKQRYKVKIKGGTISPQKRKIFTNLDKQEIETGGFLDFGKKGLENVDMYFGTTKDIEYPDKDFEVNWHTHPLLKKRKFFFTNMLNRFPSVHDLEGFFYVAKPQQTMVIFHDGSIISATKTPKFRQYIRRTSRRQVRADLIQVEKMLRDKFRRSLPTSDFLEKEAIPFFRRTIEQKFGLKLTYIPKRRQKNVKIPIKIVE